MQIPKEIAQILERLEAAGQEAYLVGGCVRDRCMGIPPHDYDITTSAYPEEMKEIFAGEWIIETGLKHGTLTVLTPLGGVEITTYRQDGTYSDHRHPDQVQFTRSLREDLARRDFTVNAMAMDHHGEVIDLFGGREDLAAGILRCVGDPCRRFEEDALRILRALRFSARLDFTVEEKTAAAMEEKAPLLRSIAGERIFSELCGLLCGKACANALKSHPAVLKTILPELILPDEKTQLRLEKAPPDASLRMAALLMDLPAETAAGALARWKVSTAFRKEVLLLVREYPIPCEKTKAAVHRRAATLGAGAFLKLAALWGEPFYARTLSDLQEEGACLSMKELAVNGADLQALGYEGVAIGAALEKLFQKVTAEQLPNEKEILLNSLK